MEGCAGFLNVLKTSVVDRPIEYVEDIRNCEQTLDRLRRDLLRLSFQLEYANAYVKEGKEKGEVATVVLRRWFQAVRKLVNAKNLREIMYQDMETAEYVVGMMRKKDLKSCLREEVEMQIVVVELIKELKERLEYSTDDEERRALMEMNYKKVVGVVVEMMEETVDEFKELIREERKFAILATTMLNNEELDILAIDDKEMEYIICEATSMNISDDEGLWPEHPAASVGKNPVKEAASKLLSPIEILLTASEKLMDDGDFKKVKLGLNVIQGLWVKSSGSRSSKKMMDPHTGCWCYYHAHGCYRISKTAKELILFIGDELLSDLNLFQYNGTQLFDGLPSRSCHATNILRKLTDENVDTVGIFGKGGLGKTMLAKQVSKISKQQFDVIVMVEVSQSPNIVLIQEDIADSLDLTMDCMGDIGQRATKLRNRLNCDGKKLIILDNVWGKLNLDEIGIPQTCKIILTTRSMEVCRVMGIPAADMFEVDTISTDEAKDLFTIQMGNKIDDDEYEEVIESLLEKCGVIPFSIVVTANWLKEKDIRSWETWVDTISDQAIFSILDMSYKAIGFVKKRIFFILACLFPRGSSASIQSLTRYGIGFNLFPRVEKLCEALDVADVWISELMLSPMLLEGNHKGEFQIHDIVRDYVTSFAAKAEGHNLKVKDIHCLLKDETFSEYTAMSLMSNYERLSGVEAAKLQILILGGDLSSQFDDNFFEGMLNLLVLDLSNVNFNPRLPDSIWKLKKLRTLCLERCKLGDMTQIGGFVNLLVLSLRESFVEELPSEIGKLHELRLLDLTACVSNKELLILGDVLDNLARLEGLYMFDTRQSLKAAKFGVEGPSVVRCHNLPRLNALEIQVALLEDLPTIDGEVTQHLDRFKIYIGCGEGRFDKASKEFGRVMSLNDIDLSGMLAKGRPPLLPKANWLHIDRCTHFENFVPQLDQEGFRDLRSLNVHLCDDVECILTGGEMNDLLAFPYLRELKLHDLRRLKIVCEGEFPRGTFFKLETLQLRYLPQLEYVLPLALLSPNLNQVDVVDCRSLSFMFWFDGREERLVVELPFLKSMTLNCCPNLISLVGSRSDYYDTTPILFDTKMNFPSLELFKLVECPNVVKLWSSSIYVLRHQGFQNLKEIMIMHCDKLLSIGLLSVVLGSLERLCIMGCRDVCEVVTHEDEEWYGGEETIAFPNLEYLELDELPNLEYFYRGRATLALFSLKILKLNNLKRFSGLTKVERSSTLFNKKVCFACLEELYVSNVNDDVTGLWEMDAIDPEMAVELRFSFYPAPSLRKLFVGGTNGMQHVSSATFCYLHSLTLSEFDYASAIFSSREGVGWTYAQLPELEELTVERISSMADLFDKEDCSVDDGALVLFCGQLKSLKLLESPKLNRVPLHLFKGLASLTLNGLTWEYVISADALVGSLQLLEFLSIESCESMEAVVINDVTAIEFPHLKRLQLFGLASLANLSSSVERDVPLCLPSLESLEIVSCPRMEHFWSDFVLVPRLQIVIIKHCSNMKQFLMGNPKPIIEFPSLRRVELRDCSSIMSIASGVLAAPRLEEVSLRECDSLECIFSGNPVHNGDLLLSSLTSVVIDRCPNLCSFSPSQLVAPRLQQTRYDHKDYSMLGFGDLNDFLGSLKPSP